ncbi:hypothetical protein [Ferrovibrio sp.]|uniref:hypothetical protein n=1 Tax=Ferrovibrio sp. TaxID=1917215 RepID=UPI00311FC1EB
MTSILAETIYSGLAVLSLAFLASVMVGAGLWAGMKLGARLFGALRIVVQHNKPADEAEDV